MPRLATKVPKNSRLKKGRGEPSAAPNEVQRAAAKRPILPCSHQSKQLAEQIRSAAYRHIEEIVAKKKRRRGGRRR